MKLKNNKLQQFIDESNKISIITGAGISTNSGIMDFKQLDEKLKEYHLSKESLLNIRTFISNPDLFWTYYRKFFDYDSIKNAKIGVVHRWITQLQQNKDVSIITQNIDGLHYKANNKNVYEIHGSNDHLVCHYCDNAYEMTNEEKPKCSFCGQLLKPNIVLYGEQLMEMDKAQSAVLQSDLLIVMGTRLTVYPCNSLVDLFLYEKQSNPNLKLVIWNNDYTSYHKYSDYNIYENFEELLEEN